MVKFELSLGAFYPNYFFRAPHIERDDRTTFKALCGRDPNTTVYFGGFDQKYIGPLYTAAIKDFFADCVLSKKSIHVSFESNNEKIFVTFNTNKDKEHDEYFETVPGRVATEVYKAIKMRRTNQQFHLRVMQ